MLRGAYSFFGLIVAACFGLMGAGLRFKFTDCRG